MDKGAHFYRCDFQVHSPRDRAWTGRKFGIETATLPALTEEEKENIIVERIQFAKEYLEKARDAGLNAIAITDHHDVVSVKRIRKVAEEENEAYISIRQFDKVITVFPGIELTLANPVCQCIIIFDADFPDLHLDSIINLFGVASADEFDKDTLSTQRISQEFVNDLVHLHKKLDEVAYCKGRYIILPNSGRSGEHSILRSGFHEHYRKMPCVGGYVDKEISEESGYQNKINGGDVNYGHKSIGLLSTSDNRFEDGREFGKYATWVKWAEPTAEAIRQACLAKESRISQVEPELPQIFIKSVDVTNSKFLGAFYVDLNRQYNALIGGRGTGKSTILEYLRWGLCDQKIDNIDFDEMTIIERRRNALIQKTLTEASGEVRITMEKNGISHIVKRNSNNKEILLKIGDGEFQQVKEDDIRKLLPIQSYSQKQLSDVGVKTEELKRFIEQPIRGKLDAISFEISETCLKLKSSYNQFVRKKEVQNEIKNFNLESESLKRQADNIRKSLEGVSDADQETINKKSKYEIEQTIVDNMLSELAMFEGKTSELVKLLEISREPLGNIEEMENKKLIESISEELDLKFIEIKDKANSLKNVFNDESLKTLNAYISDWKAKKEVFEMEYEIAKLNSRLSQQQLREILRIEKRIGEIYTIIADRNLLLKEIGSPENEFFAQKQNWEKYHSEKIQILNEQAFQFTALSKNLIKAEVIKSINLTQFKFQLKNIFEGTRIREERIDAIVEDITRADDPIKEYTSIVDELRMLAELNISDNKSFKIAETPILTSCGFTEEHKMKICTKINSDNWLLLSANELEFDPKFYYSTNNQLDHVIPFAAASAGQQQLHF